MAVKTNFNKDDFKKILSNYKLGDFKIAKPFKTGAVQTNLLLKTTKGNYVFRYYESRPEKYALFEVNVLKYLDKHLYPCPAPVINIKGNFIGKYKNKPYAIFKFMEGKHLERKQIDAEKIAQIIGKLHKITIGYKPKYYKSRDTYDKISVWKNAVKNSKKIKSKKEKNFRLKWLKDELGEVKTPNNLVKGVCHCDTHFSNFLFKEKGISAVLDFDDASYIYLIYDLANIIYFWAWPNKKDIIFDKAKNLIKAYNSQRKLTKIEKRYLFDVLKLVIFMSIGWFIDDESFYNEKRKIELLNIIGRDEFYNKLFKQ